MKDLFQEKPSQKHKENVFQAVKQELDENKTRNARKGWLSVLTSHPLQSFGLTAFLGVFLYFQFVNPLYTPSNELESNLLMELAALSPQEREVVENLDFIEDLDQLSDEELKEITL